MKKKHNQIISTENLISEDLVTKIHPLNARAKRDSCDLGLPTGLKNIGVHYVVLRPNTESTEPHFHHAEEEAIFIISGSGVANIEGQQVAIKKGDFVAYPCNGLYHSIRNDSKSDLIYLILGEKSALDLCVYPKSDKALIRTKHSSNLVNDYSHCPNVRSKS